MNVWLVADGANAKPLTVGVDAPAVVGVVLIVGPNVTAPVFVSVKLNEVTVVSPSKPFVVVLPVLINVLPVPETINEFTFTSLNETDTF